MEKRITLQKTLTVLKLSLFVIWFWPLPQSASKRTILCMQLYQCVSMLLTVAVIASVIYSIVENLDDLEVVVKSVLAVFPCSHVIWNISCHLAIYQNIQCITFEMENFCALIKPHEEAIVQREYIDKYAIFYGFCVGTFYTSLFALFVGPAVLDQSLPVVADFPFDVSHQPLRTITYLHQIVVGLFIAAHLSANAFMALLLWLTSARFKLLIENLRTVTKFCDFVKCIEKHQQVLKYAEEVTRTVRIFALGTILFSTISLLVFGLVFITEVSFGLKIQCIFLVISALVEVFMYAWPAEHLSHVSGDVARAAFETDWYNESLENVRKNLQMIIMRSQKPILVVLPYGLPSLSLHYYASYLSTIFSYFTTMRIMFEEHN